ncbi:MAG: Carbohydrate acetyl esterase/feruloyl esterase precursor [Bacteroidetes bacterium ADurb.Bin217]|nr:MAG: Carbohydrate acetyl esterase/feruloyl esterase precursor [Bacteroidetes bacterium ADurb.Bin217]
MNQISYKSLVVSFVALIISTFSLQAQDKNFYIYLCFGQSNMEGQGAIQTVDKTVDSRFKTFQALDCSNLTRTKATWYTATPPTCQCYSKLSPADYFGRTMVANLPDSITVGIINVAIGGCDIRLFDKDIYEDYDSTYAESWFTSKVKGYEWNPYEYLIDLAKLAQQDGVIKGILLHQGETNTGQSQWPSYVNKIYTDMLTDLGLEAQETPLLAGQVLSAAGSCCSSMNSIINTLPQTIPNSYVISSANCPGQDNAHFNSEGYRMLGRRYGVQMLKLLGYNAVYAEAECGTVGGDWYILADNAASNVRYITAKTGKESLTVAPTSSDASIQYSVTISKDTTYYIYGRFKNPTTSNDAFWIKIDDGDFVLYDNLTTVSWEWKLITSLDFTAGEHTITVAYAETGACLDKIAVKDSPILPVSVAEEAINVCAVDIISTLPALASNGNYLAQNVPNPVDKSTIISFTIVKPSNVTITLYSSTGGEVDTITSGKFDTGTHSVNYIRSQIPAGTYYYTITTDEFTSTRSIIFTSNN